MKKKTEKTIIMWLSWVYKTLITVNLEILSTDQK